jgi:NAD kinase
MFEKVFVITRKTRLAELIERFNTVGQARFYIEHAGGDFVEYEQEDAVYRKAVADTLRSIPSGLKVHPLDRSLTPTVLFTEKDLIVTLGQDGLVANSAKYVKEQPMIAVNPDPERFDGILMPFLPTDVPDAIASVLGGKERMREVTMAEARLQDGQCILAFNDLFIGASSHVSARYKITLEGKTEHQSSSGILVSTGAGSTGWISSVFNMTSSIAMAMGGTPLQRIHMDWEDPRLFFVTREPFISRHSTADLVTGWISAGEELLVESTMPSGGCVFSDGIEADSVEFNSGAILRVQRSAEKARLVIA